MTCSARPGAAPRRARTGPGRPALWAGLLVLCLGAAPAAGQSPQAEAWREAGRRAVERARRLHPGGPRAKNVILFVGDGMSLSTIAAARILEGQRRGDSGEENSLAFEGFPSLALMKTYNTNQQVPDSAGTMTAMVTGVKTRAGVLSVDETVREEDWRAARDHELETLLEQAEQRGMATGVVTTTTVTHATPAACYAHTPARGWQGDGDLPGGARAEGTRDIARQLVEFPYGDGLEVALGGGRSFFLPEEMRDPEYPELRGEREDHRNLAAVWAERPRSTWVWNLEQFRAIDPGQTDHLLGLFEPDHMRFALERADDEAGEPSLPEMTEKALAIVSRNPRGFVLMVEGGRIDHGHHFGNAYRALDETIELSEAVRRALERVDPAETLVLVTADHGHTLTIAGYPTRGNPILGLVVTNDDAGEAKSAPESDALGLPYTTLGYANGPGYAGAHSGQAEGAKRFTGYASSFRGIRKGRPDLGAVDTTHPDFLQEAAVPIPSETHSGEDVPLFATGPGAELFHGVQEQNYVYHAIVEALGWNDPGASGTAPDAGASPPASRAP